MRARTAQKISEALLTIRNGYYAKANEESFSAAKLDTAERYLEEIYAYIDKRSPDTERKFLCECLAMLDDIIEEGNCEKISRFAHAVHRIPLIFSGEEKWNKAFKSEYIFPFCDIYGYEEFSELLKIKIRNDKNGTVSDKRSVYRYNEMNIMSLPMYFGFRFILPIVIIAFLTFAVLYVHFTDYTEDNRGECYVITVDSFEYEHTGTKDYLYISDNDFSAKFETARFFELSTDSEELIALCESKASLTVYAEYVKPHKNYNDYYKVIHIEDMSGKVYRSYEQTNELDKYSVELGLPVILAIFIPSFILFVMMLMIASDPKRYVSHPRLVKFCFPDYSLKLKK